MTTPIFTDFWFYNWAPFRLWYRTF